MECLAHTQFLHFYIIGTSGSFQTLSDLSEITQLVNSSAGIFQYLSLSLTFLQMTSVLTT